MVQKVVDIPLGEISHWVFVGNPGVCGTTEQEGYSFKGRRGFFHHRFT